jgi:hypothetical protein
MSEIGSRSLLEPTEIARVPSLVSSSFPQVNTEVVVLISKLPRPKRLPVKKYSFFMSTYRFHSI